MNANSVLAQDRLNAMGGAGGPDGMRQALAGFKQIIDAQALVMTFSDLFFVFGVIMLSSSRSSCSCARCPRAARSRCIEPAMIPNTLLRGMLPVTAALLGGCVVGPDYGAHRSRRHAPSGCSVHARRRSSQRRCRRSAGRWWTTLGDPVLSDLVEAALASNTNVRIASARLLQSRAVLGQRTAALAPSISANTFALNNQLPVRDFVGSGLGSAGGAVPSH